MTTSTLEALATATALLAVLSCGTERKADRDTPQDSRTTQDAAGPSHDGGAQVDSGADAGGGDSQCGRRVPGYSYARPYGETAAWNVPVCGLSKWAMSDEYAERFWLFSNGRNADPTIDDPNRDRHPVDFGLDPATDYAPPVYDAADATTTRLVSKRDGWAGTINLAPNETVPWNPEWRAMEGGDRVLIILDRVTGKEWNFWGLAQADLGSGTFNDSQCWLAPGYNAATHLCAGSANLIRTPTGDVADYRTYSGNFPARGVRIQFYMGVAEPDEVEAGEIRHALMMGAANTMFGPPCTPAELETAAAGTTCGFALAPAGGLEWTGNCNACPPSSLPEVELRSRTIPEGMRLALTLTDADIDAWLDTRGYTGRKRETARIFAVALRDYGWFITDTAGVGAFAVSGSANPVTKDKWRALGIDGDGKDLLRGLLTKERLWVVEPATNDCLDGTKSQYSCRALATGY